MAKDIDAQKKTPADVSEDKPVKERDAKDTAGAKNAKDDKAKKAAKNKKPKKSIIKYFKDAKSEFKKVVWPTPKETTHNTVVVLIVCALAALFIFGIDSLFGVINRVILG